MPCEVELPIPTKGSQNVPALTGEPVSFLVLRPADVCRPRRTVARQLVACLRTRKVVTARSQRSGCHKTVSKQVAIRSTAARAAPGLPPDIKIQPVGVRIAPTTKVTKA